MKAVLVSTDGIVTAIDVPTYRDFGTALGGYLEALPVGETFTCFVDEDGKAKGLSRNPRAQRAIQQMLARLGRQLVPGDYIVGPAIFVGINGDEECDLCHEVIDDYFPELKSVA